MVQTTIIRTPSTDTRPHLAPSTASRRPLSLEERGSMLGTILMVVFSLALVAWVLVGTA